MRAAVTQNDYKSFEKGLPSKFRGGKKLFKVLQKEMGVKRLREWSEIEEVKVKFFNVFWPACWRGTRFGIGS